MQEVRPLTGLRGIAAAWVALYHIHWQAVSGGYAPAILTHGYLAVDIFFVLSGFVMTMTYTNKDTKWNGARYADFIARRIGRVWPLYIIITLCLTAAMTLRILNNEAPSAVSLLANITLTQSWWGIGPIDEPSWSVSCELLVYFTFPLLAWGLSIRKTSFYLVFILFLIACASFLPGLQEWLLGHSVDSNGPFDIHASETIVPLLRCVIGFTMGIATYRLIKLEQFSWLRKDASAILIFSALIFLLCISNTDIMVFAMTPLLIAIMAQPGRLITLTFGNRLIHSLGKWSYALYLIHFHSNALQIKAAAHLSSLGQYAEPVSYIVQYLVLIIVSSVLFSFVEKPGQRAFRRLGNYIEQTWHSPAIPEEREEGVV